MAEVNQTSFSSVSALFNIEVSSIHGRSPTALDLVRAIQSDVSRCLPISKACLFKYFCGNGQVSVEQIKEVLSALKDGMARCLEKDPDAYLSYAYASVICQNELCTRKN